MDKIPLIDLRPRYDALFVSRSRCVLITGLDGFIEPSSKQGLFVHQTRMLSRLRYAIDNEPFKPVTLSNIEQHTWLGYYIKTPPGMRVGREPAKPSQHAIELRVNRSIGDGMHEDICLTNFNLVKTSFTLTLELDADFADQVELPHKRQQYGELDRLWRKGGRGKWELHFDYRARHHYERQNNIGDAEIHRGLTLVVEESDSEPGCEGAVLRFKIELEPQASWRACLNFVPYIEGAALPNQYKHCPLIGPPTEMDRRCERFRVNSTSVAVPAGETLGAVVAATVARAKEDLAALRLYDLDDNEGSWTFAAGVPLYIALFGRDTLMASFGAVLLSTAMLSGSLAELPKWQATERNDWRDAQPGAMLHEARTSPLALLNYNPHALYYGTLTTPIFYPIALCEYWRWSGDVQFCHSKLDCIFKGFSWLENYARSPLGFYQYKTASEMGVKNQGWKDSDDAIVYGDGSQVGDPIAIVEAQGYVYAAKRQLAQFLWMMGRKDEAKALEHSAIELRKRFNDAFWIGQDDFLAMGLDGEGRQIRSIASNPGHCLTTGITEPAQGVRVADRLLADDLFSGWGIRTLSTKHPAYNPYSYHRGSVWPVEQGELCKGFWRVGKFGHLWKLARTQFELAQLFQNYRLPEVLSGHQRDQIHPFPALYPDANSPQAWSASAIFSILTSMLGVFPWAAFKLLLVDPHLPLWLPEITLRNLHIGDAILAIRFFRKQDGSSDFEVLELRGDLRIRREADVWTGIGLPCSELGEYLDAR
jgi:glycogen debranching enzyme